jgi:hypothetical protein
MDDGSKLGQGLKLSTNAFTYSDCLLLVKTIHDNFSLKASIQSAGAGSNNSQFNIYI